MNLQVLFLTLVTGLFMAAWSTDQPAGARRPTARGGLEPDVPVPAPQVSPSHSVDSPAAAEVTGMPSTHPCRPAQSYLYLTAADFAPTAPLAPTAIVVTVDSCPVPLPSDITAGRYRLVDYRGKTLTLVVTDADVDCLGLPDRSSTGVSYTSKADRWQWHFVRIESPHDLRLTGDGSQPADAATIRTSAEPANLPVR